MGQTYFSEPPRIATFLLDFPTTFFNCVGALSLFQEETLEIISPSCFVLEIRAEPL